MADYAGIMVEAVDIVVDKRIREASYDRTIKAIVIDITQASKGTYTCKYESTTFTAVGTPNEYNVNDVVMVNIPQNDWSGVKTILNKVYYEIINNTTIDPLVNFLDVNNNKPLVFYTEEIGLIANDTEYTSRVFSPTTTAFSSFFNEPYTKMAITASFKTKDLAAKYNVVSGNYGIRINFKKEGLTIAQYEFNTLNFFGNLYGFDDYIPQKVMVDIDPSLIDDKTQIQVECFQGNDFECQNTNNGTRERLAYAGEVEPNIFFKDVNIYFGYDKAVIKDGDLILYSDSQPQYYKKWDDKANTKTFTFTYWQKDLEGNLIRTSKLNNNIRFEKRLGNETDWTILTELKDTIKDEELDKDKIDYRIVVTRENFDTESLQRYTEIESNVLTFYKYETVPTSEDYDLLNALSFKYEQSRAAREVMSGEYDTNSDSDIIKTELQYNEMENQLMLQDESFLPHSIQVYWNPTTKRFQKSNFLAGATITYKVPAADTTDYFYNSAIKATNRFKQELTTVFLHPTPGQEYGSGNTTTHYETIDEVTYLCWSVTLSDNFAYDASRTKLEHGWGNSDQTSVGMQAFALDFRPKEYYLPTMINNTIIFSITKDDLTFEGTFEVPINVDTSKALNRTFILPEDMEKPFAVYSAGMHRFYERKIIHFTTFRQNYTGQQTYGNAINLMRPTKNGLNVFKSGYYYEDGGQLIRAPRDGEIDWYTLIIEPSDDAREYDFLMLQTKNEGITSIINIPVFEYADRATQATQEVITGIDRIYCGAGGIGGDGVYGPSEKQYKITEFSLPNPHNFTSWRIIRMFYPTGESIQLNSYESSKNEIFYPEIKQLSVPCVAFYDSSSLDNIDISDVNDRYFKLYKKGYKDDSSERIDRNSDSYYVAGVVENHAPAGQQPQYYGCWYDINDNLLFSVQVPTGSHIECDFSVYKKKTTTQGLFLRQNQVGFTTNYKEVGSGDNYPAESACTTYNTLPIVFQQIQTYRDDFAQWDGTKVQIGEDAVFSPVVGAGRKDSEGKFSGCIMGDVSTIDLSQGSDIDLYGLYGYHQDVQSFGLRADGTLFLGKAGNGQILMDGNESTLQSSVFKTSDGNKGMGIDLDDAKIYMMNSYNYTSQADIDRAIAAQQAVVDDIEEAIIKLDDGEYAGALVDLYNSSKIYDYTQIPNGASYDQNVIYYYIDFITAPIENYIYYYTTKSTLEASDGKYFSKSGNTYTPMTIIDPGLSVYFRTIDSTANPNKQYYTLENGTYVQQDVPVNDDHGFVPGTDYYERNYYYERVSYMAYVNELDFVEFSGTSAQWDTMKSDGVVFYTRTIGTYRKNNQTQQGPAWGYELRADDGVDPRTSYPTGDDKEYYYSLIKTGENTSNEVTYYNGSWMVRKTNFDGRWQKYNLNQDDIDKTAEALSYRMIDSKDVPDPVVTQYENAYSLTVTTHSNYNNSLDDLINNLYKDYQNKFEYYTEGNLKYKLASDKYHQDESTFLAAEQTYEQALDDYNHGLIPLSDYQNAYNVWLEANTAWEIAQSDWEVAQSDYGNKEEGWATAKKNWKDGRANTIDTLNTHSKINEYLTTVMFIKGTLPAYASIYLHNNEFSDNLAIYQTLLDEFINENNKLEELKHTHPNTPKPYGIKLDASEDNIISGGEIDKTKFPLMIGELTSDESAKFRVNWAGELFSTGGKIGGWLINKNTLSAASKKKGQLVLCSNASKYPLQIGDTFKVDWEGNVTASVIHLGKGTLYGDEKGTVIKDIDEITYKGGGGLKLGADGFLHLDKGIKLVEGGSIRAGNSVMSLDNDGFKIDGNFTVTGNNITSINRLKANLQFAVGQREVSWKQLKYKDHDGQNKTMWILANN